VRIRVEHGLAYVEALLTYHGRTLHLRDVILDTGSAGTLFSADRLLDVALIPEPLDPLRRIRGVGGTEFAFAKRLDVLAIGEIELAPFEIEVGAMEYGFPADGILGLDFLLKAGAVIDLGTLDLRPGGQGAVS
jgi:hypothetical protein